MTSTAPNAPNASSASVAPSDPLDPLAALARTTLRIGILETGRPGRTLTQRHGDFPALVQAWLGSVAPAWGSPASAAGAAAPTTTWQRFAALDGELPERPGHADLWVITGSYHGVYEDHAYIAPTEDFIRRCAAERVPMVGICFGHQLMAQAMGGVVRKSERGWGVGRHVYRVEHWPAEFGPALPELALAAFHQDQVETLPPSAQRVAGSAFCPNAALFYPGWGFSVQGHPEFTPAYLSDLINMTRGKTLPEDVAAPALATLGGPTQAAELAAVVRSHWLKSPPAPSPES